MNKRVYIDSKKKIVNKCRNWALLNIPKGLQIVDDIYSCYLFFSVKYDKILKPTFLESRHCHNFHHNIPPNYAGVSTIAQSISSGEKYVRVTLHKINSGLEAEGQKLD